MPTRSGTSWGTANLVATLLLLLHLTLGSSVTGASAWRQHQPRRAVHNLSQFLHEIGNLAAQHRKLNAGQAVGDSKVGDSAPNSHPMIKSCLATVCIQRCDFAVNSLFGAFFEDPCNRVFNIIIKAQNEAPNFNRYVRRFNSATQAHTLNSNANSLHEWVYWELHGQGTFLLGLQRNNHILYTAA